MKVFTCDDNFDAIMSAIYDVWCEAIKIGYSNVSVIRKKDVELNLFDEYIETVSDPIKSEKVINTIQNKISTTAYYWCYYVALSCDMDAPDVIFRFLILGFKKGKIITTMLQNPQVMRMMEIYRRVNNEANFFREIARFNSIDNKIYISHIEPKNNVIMYVANHFSDRMPSENFMIIDDNRRIAAIHPEDGETYFRSLTENEFEKLSGTESYTDEFTVMWKTFFDAIAIQERFNPTCQRNLFPIWKRKHATEFME